MGTVNEVRHFDIADEVLHGRIRAHEKHGDNSIEAIAADDPRWLSILVEEVGEVAHELTYDAEGGVAALRSELLDVIAVAMAWISSIDGPEGPF